MPNIKVTIDGQEHEVDLKDVKAGEGAVVHSQEAFDKIIGQRLTDGIKELKTNHKTALQDQKTALKENDDFLSEVFEAKGIKVDDEGNVIREASPEKVKELQAGWSDKYLSPVEKERDALLQERDQARKTLLMKDIQAVAIKEGVKESVLQNPFDDGAPSAFVQNLANQARWDDDGGVHFVSAKGDKIMTPDGDLATVEDRMASLKDKDKEFVWFDDARPQDTKSSGSRTPGGQSTKGQVKRVKRSYVEDLGPQAQAEFFKKNPGVQVVDD